MIFVLSFLGCFPSLPEKLDERFVDNPNHDYDGDGFLANDCDDGNPDIQLPIRYYKDGDQDGFGLESDSILVCPADLPAGYIPAQRRDGVAVFDCNDNEPAENPDNIEICGDNLDNDCSGVVDDYMGFDAPRWYYDADQDGFGDMNTYITRCDQIDGYVDNINDCDDSDAQINPDMPEKCDTIDNNCNGIIDENTAVDAPIWYQDIDLDGFGNPFVSQPSCTQPENYILNNQDCDDQHTEVSPLGIETCNNADDDCDGFVDEGSNTTAPANSTVSYADYDQDGYGDPNISTMQCGVPNGYVTNDEDCNDGNANISPSAAERCNDIDDDCDGQIDGDNAIDTVPWYADSDGDGYGFAGDVAFGCASAGIYIPQQGDCDDNNPTIHPSSRELCDGVDNNCDGLLDDADANLDVNTANIYYQDVDLDGFGNPNVPIHSCLQPPGFVLDNSDCDDTSWFRNTTGMEHCNNIDDNCDGQIDEFAIEASAYYVDGDGDGHGTLVDSITGYDLYSCPLRDPLTNTDIYPTGFAPTNDDCDDGNADISPSAPELCTATIDENCDGRNTVGALDVSMYLVDADNDGFGSGQLDNQGNLAYRLDLCVQPYGYVLYADGDGLDCDDGNSHRNPSATELCNGQLDRCDGSNITPTNEIDHDGDGFVQCTLDVDPLQWADLNAGIIGGDDCNDGDMLTYPGATEICDGFYQNCNTMPLDANSNYDLLATPNTEIDDDGDFFIECENFDPNLWLGDPNIANNGGGNDCDDTNPNTFPGAASISSTVECFREDNFDEIADCVQDYYGNDIACDPSASVDIYGIQFDFAYIPAGNFFKGSPSPTSGFQYGYEMGRKTNEYQYEVELTHDLYAMSHEVTQEMYERIFGELWKEEVVDFHGIGPNFPLYQISWHMAADFANAITARHNTMKNDTLSACYTCTDSGTLYTNCAQSMNPYQCDGYRLPTEVEWEYMSRAVYPSPTSNRTQWPSKGFWTDDGIGNIPVGQKDNCTDSNWVFVQGTSTAASLVQSSYTLDDYAWYCANSFDGVKYNTHDVMQKLPNAFELYDLHGNVGEWCHDYIELLLADPNLPTQTDMLGSIVSTYRSSKGGSVMDPPRVLRDAAEGARPHIARNPGVGIRLVRIANP